MSTHIESQTVPESEVVYEDNHIRVMFRQGGSAYLFITFGDLSVLANGKRFYAEGPARKLNLTTLGIMAKRPTWYPEQSMRNLADSLHHVLARYPKKVVNGSSMGGYGAVKHSALLQATTVLAYCPQSTIDPNECSGESPGWQHLFDASLMRGMGVTPKDIHGDIYVFYDPNYAIDLLHRNRIVAANKSTISIPVLNGSHDIAPVLAGTENLKLLIEGCLNRDIQSIALVVNRARRKSYCRKRGLIDAALVARPVLLSKVVRKLSQVDAEILALTLDKKLHFIQNVVKKHDLKELNALLKFFGSQLPVHSKLALIPPILGEYNVNLNLKTCFGTKVMFNSLEAAAVHVNSHEEKKDKYKELSISIAGTDLSISIAGRTFSVLLTPSESGELKIATKLKETFLIQERSDGQIHLSCSGRYLSGQPDGSLLCDRAEAGDWETFSFELNAQP